MANVPSWFLDDVEHSLTAGVAAALTGIAGCSAGDRARIARGSDLLGALHDWFRRRGGRVEKRTRAARGADAR